MENQKRVISMKPFLDIKNLSRVYRGAGEDSDTSVLSDLNLQMSEGKSLGLIGPSGSGKSTFLNLISGLDTPTSGEVWVGGKQVHNLSSNEAASFRNQTIGFIFQSHHLLPALTALENVIVPALAGHSPMSSCESEDRACDLLDQVGLKDRAKHLPSQLSGGERQRVAVARALINHPKLLLADEPTGALDRTNADNLMEILLRLNQECKCTLLMVTHSEDQAKKMDEVCFFENGKLKRASP